MTARNVERFWSLLGEGALAELLQREATWDDPLAGAAAGDRVRDTAIPALREWYASKAAGSPRHLRTTASDQRVVVEHVLDLREGLVWNQAERRSQKAERFELATAIVADRATGAGESYASVRIYFGTWSVLDGEPRVRVGPICPDERAATKAAMDAVPTVRTYFTALEKGDSSIVELFEPDGYFREPANNFACGRAQLLDHFQHILGIGGVGIEFMTATREGPRIGLEIQTVRWGPKTMDAPQAGFAIYELGPHDKLQGSRVYDSVVPPKFD